MGITLMTSAGGYYSNVYPNSGAHNSIYRGKFLGHVVTNEQFNQISAGTFNDMFIGDYWTTSDGDYTWRIAAFDYFIGSGDTACTDHHVVIVPDEAITFAAMNKTDTTVGGYVGSNMYKSIIKELGNLIRSMFGDHALTHRIYLTDGVANGHAASGDWYDSEVDLMCEQMVYGSGIFSPVSGSGIPPVNHRVEKSQLPLFQHEPSRIRIGRDWWLRDVITDSAFAAVNKFGNASYYNARFNLGVRPYFCIK